MNQNVVLIVLPRDGARSFELRGKKDLLLYMKILKGRQRETTAYDCLISRYNLHVHMALFAIYYSTKYIYAHFSVVGGLQLVALTSSINLIISWQRSQRVLSLCVS